MNNYVNKIFTIKDLKSSASKEALEKYGEYVEALKVIEKQSDTLIKNGRVNHYWFQEIIAILTDNQLTSGGQGNSEPDMYWGDKLVEIKGFTTSEWENHYPIRVAASKYFASNGGITKLKNCDKTIETMREIVFSDSYKDDYYILSETCSLRSMKDLEDVRLVLLEASLLKKYLIDDCGPHTKEYSFEWADPYGKERRKKINWPFIHINTKKMISEIKEFQCQTM